MLLIAVAAVAVTAVIALVAVRPWGGGNGTEAGQASTATSRPAPDGTRTPAQLRTAFLDDYVQGGRVVRKDQGGDTVSEGQSYGMLVAFAAGDRTRFADIWRWTKSHLRTDDGLLAWAWTKQGGVSSDQSASDADLDAARALVLAGEHWHDQAYEEAGKAMAKAIVDHETVRTDVGRILLPGPWADTSSNGPWTYDPSYASPAAFRLLAAATGDPAWTQLETGSRAVTTRILDSTSLPSDWAQVQSDGSVNPMPSASGSGGQVVYGWDAMRLPLRYAESCSAADRDLAAKLAPTLQRTTRLAAQLDLGGTAVTDDTSSLAYAARAATEVASGQGGKARSDLATADRTAATTPTYYGDAWAALAATMLTSDALGGCATDGGAAS
jgi:endoglucanase